MGGLATAWELSSGEWRKHIDSITVYQRGWRLGGKGASSRGRFGRIEEHGLHVLLGYYDATFRVLREVYGELNRDLTDPACPIRSWQDALSPAGDIGPGSLELRIGRSKPWRWPPAPCGCCLTSIERWPYVRRRLGSI